jgi:hypothetical protein
VAGVVVGSVVGWLSSRPRGPFIPNIVQGRSPETKIIRDDDGHYIRTWTIQEPVDAVADELSHELQLRDGWQPAWLRSLQPKMVQFVRVKSPNGDFQFTRLTVTDIGLNKTNLTIDEEPKQAHAFK